MVYPAAFVFAVLFFAGCSTVRYGQRPSAGENSSAPPPPVVSAGTVYTGIASFYGNEFHGSRTSSGEIFSQDSLTAAHPFLPFQTTVKVTNKKNGKSVIVRINDRGPFVAKRIIDLSRAAAEQIGLTKTGLAEVTVEVLTAPDAKE